MFRFAVFSSALVLLARSAAAQPPPEPEPEPKPEPADSETDRVFAEIESDLSDPNPEKKNAAKPDEPPRKDAGRSLNPDISLVADFAFAWFSDDDAELQTGGHDPSRNGFNLQALELSLQSAVDPYFRFDSHLALTEFGIEIEEAYATTTALPNGLQARGGLFLTRFGRHNATHLHKWDFVDQPFEIGRIFGGEGNRGLGAEISWLTPLPWYLELVLSVTQADGEGTARSFYGSDDLGVDTPADLLYVAAVKQFFELAPAWSLLWGVSGAFGPNSTGRTNRTEVYGTDLYVHYRNITEAAPTVVTWQTEIFHRRRQVPEEVLWDLGGYTQLFWRFAQRWGTAGRYEYGSPTFDLDGNEALDPLDPEWVDARHRVAANVTFWPSEFARLRLQGSSDVPGWRPDPIWAVFFATEFAIGAHGAHQF